MNKKQNAVFEAVYAASTPTWSSIFDAQGPAYSMGYSRDRAGAPQEGASLRFAWNEAGLYLVAELEDSQCISTRRADEELHFQYGDVLELFVKPAWANYYWEMYATPFGNKTTLFFPAEREQMTLDQFLKDHPYRQLQVSAQTTASGWRAWMHVPAQQLTALGAAWGAGEAWTVLCGRYNYNRSDLLNPELSMAPVVSAENFHLLEEYATLRLSAPAAC